MLSLLSYVVYLQVKEYDTIITELQNLANRVEIDLIWLSPDSNFATLSAIEVISHHPTEYKASHWQYIVTNVIKINLQFHFQLLIGKEMNRI